MNCIICNAQTEYFLSKRYLKEPIDLMMKDIGEVIYHKCPNCGFTFSKTHFELEDAVWGKLNYDFHGLIAEGEMNASHGGNYPPYLEQAMMVYILSKYEILSTKNVLDYAGGTGTFSDILLKYFAIPSLIYEPYMHKAEDPRFIKREELGQYDIVFNSAMFEHIRSRSDLDEVNRVVPIDGALIIHSVICENIPADPDWFYFSPPVHCAFHTNKSMDLLMKQWGYSSSIYSPKAKSWVLLKIADKSIQEKIRQINGELKDNFLVYMPGFVDYWKGF